MTSPMSAVRNWPSGSDSNTLLTCAYWTQSRPAAEDLEPTSHHEDTKNTKGHEEKQKTENGKDGEVPTIAICEQFWSIAINPFPSFVFALLRAPFVFFVSSW
jgi:hypothetical protein